jgi:hypothetical protein
MSNVTHPTPNAEAFRLQVDVERIAIRLRGLGDLVGSASCNEADAEVISRDAAYFIATELQDMAERLVKG